MCLLQRNHFPVERLSCITEHKSFPAVCLNREVLWIDLVSLHDRERALDFLAGNNCPPGAEKDIRQRKDEISCYLCPRREWKFQPPSTSHMSGIWERLIRSVSKMMKAVLGYPKAFVGLETLRIVFAEVVTSLNSRPVTPVSDDRSDYEPLTPSHFLLQRQNFALPPGCFEHDDLYRRKQWRRAQFLADCF